MALIKCSECGHEISKKAKTCQNCGHERNKKSSRSGFLGLIFLIAIISYCSLDPAGTGTGHQKKEVAKEEQPAKSPRQKQIENQFSPFDGQHWGLGKYIMKSMNDPASYDHVKTVYWDRGDHLEVLTKFRGKNAFGAVVKNSVRAKVSIDGENIEIIKQL